MEKIKLDPASGRPPLLGIYPAIMIGVLVDGQPDFTTVAWTGVAASVPPTLTIALQHHRHSLKGVRRNMVFSVNIPSEDMVKETDYCGLVSGTRTDKAADCGFTVFYGANPNAPFIRECPVSHACEVVQILNLGSHELIVGRIVETFVSEKCLTDGHVDPLKVRPLVYLGKTYNAVGEPLGDSFSIGKSVKPGARLDMLEELGKMPAKA